MRATLPPDSNRPGCAPDLTPRGGGGGQRGGEEEGERGGGEEGGGGTVATHNDVDRVTKEVSKGFGDIFAEEYQKAGYQLVQSPGPDVLRVRTAVIDLAVIPRI